MIAKFLKEKGEWGASALGPIWRHKSQPDAYLEISYAQLDDRDCLLAFRAGGSEVIQCFRMNYGSKIYMQGHTDYTSLLKLAYILGLVSDPFKEVTCPRTTTTAKFVTQDKNWNNLWDPLRKHLARAGR